MADLEKSDETDPVAPDAREDVDFAAPPAIHDGMTLSSRWGGVDMERYLAFRRDHPDQYQAIMARGNAEGVTDRPHTMPRNDVALFMTPKMSGYSPIDVNDLTAVEIEGRRRVRQMKVGTRHSRRLVGVTT